MTVADAGEEAISDEALLAASVRASRVALAAFSSFG
jgi:hypothetical protein